TSPPAAAPSSSSWKARPCRPWPPCRRAAAEAWRDPAPPVTGSRRREGAGFSFCAPGFLSAAPAECVLRARSFGRRRDRPGLRWPPGRTSMRAPATAATACPAWQVLLALRGAWPGHSWPNGAYGLARPAELDRASTKLADLTLTEDAVSAHAGASGTWTC